MLPSRSLAPVAALPLLAAACAAGDRHRDPQPPRRDHHQLIIHETPADWGAAAARRAGVSVSPRGLLFTADLRRSGSPEAQPTEHECSPIQPRHLFNEVLVSWNVAVPPGWGFTVEIRVGRGSGDSWTPYLHVGHGGEVPDAERAVSCEEGCIDVDYFRSPERFDRAQYRLRAVPPRRREASAPGGTAGVLRVARIALCFSDRAGLSGSQPAPLACPPPSPAPAPPPAAAWMRRLPVPFRSQRAEDPALAGRICSPTSVAMVLAYHGVERPTAEIARDIYDRAHDIYGNWPRAVQTAFSLGVPGYLHRYSDWDAVKAEIARGQPLIISISAGEGELTGAPYPSTSGHLLVLTGFDPRGDVCVNDPAAPSEEKGRTVYLRRELEKVWMGKGGTAYVLEARPSTEP